MIPTIKYYCTVCMCILIALLFLGGLYTAFITTAGLLVVIVILFLVLVVLYKGMYVHTDMMTTYIHYVYNAAHCDSFSLCINLNGYRLLVVEHIAPQVSISCIL